MVLVVTVMLFFIEDTKHSHDSANFVAGASSISSKAEVESVTISLHSVLHTLNRQQLTPNCLYVASHSVSVFSLWLITTKY